ncbi:BZ3500_MvSof-1268-A1-R1_Chr9g10305 [Microbotryum saponariae]|uniref:BZ3500_MvSof-1268-A1-R1_Chr9g10305 protein n=1 Tax=Microbotryum saponariae TaxID=289078 RepID=A0A2X0LU29_9BASI|nr:BZ3501_MvSof-1269-A2-R1_Chr9g10055 [Microbotryum saponariae]SCZ99885.1 BZ3500_MvSof-1268-A1-R1_Chr9g10305 [Microbotryum saponariae]
MFDIASLLKATQEGVFGVGSEKERGEEKERVGPPTPRNLQPSFDHRLPVTPRATLAPESQSQITPKATESTVEANSPEVEDMTTPTSQPQAPFRPVTNESSPSTSPSASKATSYTNRKEPPKVDLKLEMELEMERAMASSTEFLPGSADRTSFAPASVPTLPLLSPPARSPGSVILPYQEPVKFGDASIAVAPSPSQTKRRRSLGSILNRSPSKDRLNTISGSSNTSRSTTPEPSMSTSTSANSLSGPSTSTNGQPPALGPIALRGIQDSAVHKSLPPTPTGSQVSNSPRPQLADEPPAAGKGDAASGPGRSFLPKGKSSTTGSVFQVISATTSKRRPSFSSNTVLDHDLPYPSGPPPPIPSGSRSTSSSTLGKRIVGVLAGGTKPNSISHERKASQFDVSTFPGEESSLNPSAIPSAPLVRRKSFSNLLGGIGDKKPAQALLGMSLSAARKSEEFLGRFNAGAKKKAQSGEVGGAEPGASRTSFDVLNRPTEANRRPSMDALSNGPTIQTPPILHNKQSYSSTMSSESLPSISNGSSSSLSEIGHVERAQLVHQTLSSGMPSRSMESVRATRATAHLIGTSSTMLAPTRSASPTSSGYRTASPTPARPPDASAESTPAERASLVNGKSLQSSSTSHPIKWRKRVRGVAPVSGAESTFSKTWLKMEDALATYKAAVRENRGDRGPLVSGTILAFLRTQEDAPSPRVTPSLATQQRQVLFGWLDVLTTELREMQPTHRGICLEAVAAILECHFTSTLELQDDEASQAQYRSAVVKVLSFAIEKLNDKAVYANTLVFSGRILALSFFRIEGVALKLLKALPPIKKAYLRRILEEVGVDEYNLPAIDLDVFPPHLWDLCLRDMRSYTNLLLPTVAKPTTEDASVLVSDGEVVIDMSGNWLIRWTASDSDLPFAFYRAYHRQLAAQLVPIEAREEFNSLPPVDPSAVITAPGCLFLAASILEKTDALIHRNLRSVTSITPNNSNFNTNDSANLSFGQKPKILELANRRVVATLLDIVGGSPAPPGDTTSTLANSDAETRRRVFGKMLQLWIRACVKKTSLWDTRSVFILLDLLEGMIYTLSYPPPSASKNMDDEHIVPRPAESCLEMFDIPFIFSFIRIILAEADNTVTVMRTIAFIYAHFEIFTLRPSDRKELCENIILDKVLFPRLYLHWNAGVRGYFIRLLVWRLARLGVVDAEQHPDAPRDPAILALFGLMNVRLEAIRRRHDELEPLDTLTDDDMFKPKRSTICSTRGVKEAPFTVDELVGALPEDSEDSDSDDDEVKQEMFRSSPALTSSSSSFPPLPGDGSSTPPSSANGSGGKKGVPSVARVVSWLKGGLGKKQHASGKQSSISSMEELRSNSRINPFILDSVASAKNKLRNPRQPNGTGSSASSVRSLSSVDSADSAARSSPEQSDPAWATVPSTPEYGEAADTPMPLDPRPSSPAFFAFEFEGAAVAPAAAETPPIVGDSMPRSGGAPSISGLSIVSGDTVFPQQPRRRSMLLHGAAGANGSGGGTNGLVSPRVSLRFSKRISILPPAALDLFRESGAPVPAIPERFRAEVYDRTLHQYAVRSLREYEDALDEWTDWVARLQQEEDEGKKFNKGFVDAVPRLAVSWPSSFEAEE